MPSPLRTRDDGRDADAGNRGDSQDARAWVTVAVVVVIVLLAYLGVSAGLVGSLDDRSAPRPQDEPPPTPVQQTAPGGLEDLGALPGLLDDFSTPDCDFDDALSTCQ